MSKQIVGIFPTTREQEGQTMKTRSERTEAWGDDAHVLQFEAVPHLRKPKEIYLILNDERIAMRGKPGTPQAGTWISLKPGYTITDINDLNGIEIAFGGARVH
jgi:hypothetical protein